MYWKPFPGLTFSPPTIRPKVQGASLNWSPSFCIFYKSLGQHQWLQVSHLFFGTSRLLCRVHAWRMSLVITRIINNVGQTCHFKFWLTKDPTGIIMTINWYAKLRMLTDCIKCISFKLLKEYYERLVLNKYHRRFTEWDIYSLWTDSNKV